MRRSARCAGASACAPARPSQAFSAAGHRPRRQRADRADGRGAAQRARRSGAVVDRSSRRSEADPARRRRHLRRSDRGEQDAGAGSPPRLTVDGRRRGILPPQRPPDRVRRLRRGRPSPGPRPWPADEQAHVRPSRPRDGVARDPGDRPRPARPRRLGQADRHARLQHDRVRGPGRGARSTISSSTGPRSAAPRSEPTSRSSSRRATRVRRGRCSSRCRCSRTRSSPPG